MMRAHSQSPLGQPLEAPSVLPSVVEVATENVKPAVMILAKERERLPPVVMVTPAV